MEVYEFKKSILDRVNESNEVLRWKDEPISALQVRSEWIYYIEIGIEPTGWQALWRIPRILCNEFNIKYPAVVYGNVENVLFGELKAVFTVVAVQDDDIHLPHEHEVQLIDLWPTIQQENSELNVERTADCLDRLRFFYRQIWMPWDNDSDDDIDWPDKHLETRIRFLFDLKTGMSAPMVNRIRKLIEEAHYIQSRREYLENNLSDDEDIELSPNKSRITDLTGLHLRLAMIRNELEILENPEMRKLYDDSNSHDFTGQTPKKIDSDTNPVTYVLSITGNISEHIEFLQNLKKTKQLDKKIVKFCLSLQDCLSRCNVNDEIHIPNGTFTINYSDRFKSGITISGSVDLFSTSKRSDPIKIDPDTQSIIMSTENDSTLFGLDDDLHLENLVLDCRNMRCGMIIRKGCITINNCLIIGCKDSLNTYGFDVHSESKLIIKNCILFDFPTGIFCHPNSSLDISESILRNCDVSIELNEDCELKLIDVLLSDTKNQNRSIIWNTFIENDRKEMEFDHLSSDLQAEILSNCTLDSKYFTQILVHNKSDPQQLNLNNFLLLTDDLN